MAHDHNSDPAMAAALQRRLRQTLDASGKDCPDPSILAGYFDHDLPAAEASRWEAHFSVCARCQEQLAVFARTESALPSIGGQASAFRRFWTLRWVAPLATAAAAVALWVAIRPAPPTDTPPQVAVVRQPAATEIPSPARAAEATNKVSAEMDRLDKTKKRALADANANANLPAPTIAQSKPDRLKQEESKASTGKLAAEDEIFAYKTPEPSARIAAAPKPAAQEPAAQTGVEGRMNARAGREAVSAEKKSSEYPAQAAAASQQVPAEQTQKTKSQDLAQRAEMKEQTRDRSVPTTTGAVAEKQEDSALASGLRRGQTASARTGMLVLDRGLTLVRPPVRGVVWRFGAQGLIEKSVDGGKMWMRQSSPVSADLLAGSAPSEKVCWLAGAAGTVLRTTDGERWETLSSPSAADLQSISARDALNAVVVAADGKSYLTSDGGRTWRPQ